MKHDRSNEGFLKLFRRFFHNPLWHEARSYSRAEAFLDMLQLAAHAPTKLLVKATLVKVDAGQLVGTQRFLAERWGWSTTKARTFLTYLETNGTITLKTKQDLTMITLCNYKDYNHVPVVKKTRGKQQENTAVTPEKQADNKSVTPQNRIKEHKEQEEPENKKMKKAAAAAVVALPFSSDEFREAWEQWLSFRAAKRKPVSVHAVRLTFADFTRWGEAGALASMRNSMRCDYQGLYAPDEGSGRGAAGKPAGGPPPRARRESYNEEPRLLPD